METKFFTPPPAESKYVISSNMKHVKHSELNDPPEPFMVEIPTIQKS